MTNPFPGKPARTFYLNLLFPIAKKPRLYLRKRCASKYEKSGPRQTLENSETRQEQFCSAKTQKYTGNEIGRGAQRKVENTGHDCASRTDKVLRRIVRWTYITDLEPGRYISRVVGDKREKKNGSNAQRDQSEYFVPSVMPTGLRHFA
jgi:hypothetical protein